MVFKKDEIAYAKCILASVSTLQDINFDKQGAGSLVENIAKACKVRCDRQLRNNLKYLWSNPNSPLRSFVTSALEKKETKDKVGCENCTATNGIVSYADAIKYGKKSQKCDKSETDANKTIYQKNDECNAEEINSKKIDKKVEILANEAATAAIKIMPNNKSKINEVFLKKEKLNNSIIKEGQNSYSVTDVKGDGNCLFRCMAHCLYNDENLHSVIRSSIVDYVTSNWKSEAELLTATCQEKIYNNPTEYKKEMGQIGTYGTDYEISVFVRIYKVAVTVFRNENNNLVKVQDLCLDDCISKLNLMFLGEQRSGHWVILLKLGNTPNNVENVSAKEDIVGEILNNDEIIETTATEDNMLPLVVENIEKISKVNGNNDVKNVVESSIVDSYFNEEHTTPNRITKNSEYKHIKKSTNKNLHEKLYSFSSDESNDSYEFMKTKKTLKERKNDTCKESSNSEEGTNSSSDSCCMSKSNGSRRKNKYSDKNKRSKHQQNVYNFSSDTECSSTSTDVQSDNTKINRSKVKKNLKRNATKKMAIKVFTVDIGTVQAPCTYFKDELGIIDEGKIRVSIEKIMLHTLRCTCSLRFYGKVRINEQDIVAYAKCRSAEHQQRYRFRIDHLSNPVSFVHVASDHELKYVHKDISYAQMFKPLRGEERKKWLNKIKFMNAVEVLAEVQKTTSPEILRDGHPQELRRLNVLYTAKSMEKTKHRLSLKSSDLEDLIQLWINQHTLVDPFLRYVALPLTAIMYTAEDLLLITQNKRIILHMDATGTVVRKPQDLECKRIFYYSILCKHEYEVIEILRMITSEHNILSISTALKQYKNFVIKTINKWPFVYAVTIDWSWPSIHSILEEWNMMSISKYLEIMFEHCKNPGTEPPKGLTLLKICFAHFMKIISRRITTKYPQYKEIKGFILECMSLLCLSRNLQELDEIFKHVCKILSCQLKETANENIIAIGYFLKKKNHFENGNDSANKYKKDKEETESDEDCDMDLPENEKNDTIYKNSPFYKRYKDISICVLSSILEEESTDLSSRKNYEKNKYYAPCIFDDLVIKWMPYVILWSALDLDLIDKNISRVSNAFVESTHKINKYIVFKKTGASASIADRVRQLENARKETIAKINLKVNLKDTKTKSKPHYPETVSNPFIEEQWSRKRNVMNRKRGHVNAPQMEKLYSKLTENVLSKKRKSTSTVKDECTNNESQIHLKHSLLDAELQFMSVKGHMEGKEEYKETKPNDATLDTDNTVKRAKNPTSSIDVQERVSQIKLDKYYNGLVKDIHYYMSSSSSSITVGRYQLENCVTSCLIELSAKEYCSLKENAWVNGQIIDAFTAINIHEWNSVSYINTDESRVIIGDFSEKRINKNRKIFKTKQPLKDTIYIPYLYCGHWRLLQVDVKKETLTLLDPYEQSTDEDRAIKAFINFIKMCDSQSSFSKIRNINWKVDKVEKRPYQPDNDGHNCAIYVMHYMESFATNKNNAETFNVKDYRIDVAKSLLLKSQNMSDTCLHCFSLIKQENSSACIMCKRKSHVSCIHKSKVNTDDEANINEKPKGKRQYIETIETQTFTCKLCTNHCTNRAIVSTNYID